MKAFECKTCGTCCYGKGGITVNEKETENIADFLNIQPDVFVEKYCETRNNKLYIRTGKDNYCIFFHKEKMCLIHPVKPDICALWPFFPANVEDKHAWDLAKEACPGINPDCTFEEFVKQSKRSL